MDTKLKNDLKENQNHYFFHNFLPWMQIHSYRNNHQLRPCMCHHFDKDWIRNYQYLFKWKSISLRIKIELHDSNIMNLIYDSIFDKFPTFCTPTLWTYSPSLPVVGPVFESPPCCFPSISVIASRRAVTFIGINLATLVNRINKIGIAGSW